MTTRTLSVQVSPAFLLDEGVEPALDFLVECGVNALHLCSHSYYGGGSGTPTDYPAWHRAPDHPPRGRWRGRAQRAWIRHEPGDYSDLGLGHHGGDDEPFAAICAAAQQRGLRVYARYLDGWSPSRDDCPGWPERQCQTTTRERLPIPCFAHPEVIEWTRRTGADIGRYPVAGILYGIERGTPLSDVGFRETEVYCDCAACRRAAGERGIDFDRALAGLAELRRIRGETDANGADNAFVRVLRLLLDNPDLLALDRLHQDQLVAVETALLDGFRATHPDGETAVLAMTEGDPIKAARADWAATAARVDALAIRLYHHIEGARMAEHARSRSINQVLAGLGDEGLLAWQWLLGNHRGNPRPLAEVADLGLDAEDATHTLRAGRRACGTQAATQVALGVDITHPFPTRRSTPPAFIERVVDEAMSQGIETVILCREYQEIAGASMRAAAVAMDLPIGSPA